MDNKTVDEKAKELINKFEGMFIAANADSWTYEAKQCALICVDEILSDKHRCNCEQSVVIDGKYETYITYWQSVRTAIEKH